MIKLTTFELQRLKELQGMITRNLTEALDRTGEVGGIVSIDAPMLCREAIKVSTEIRQILDTAEDHAARAGEINSQEDQRENSEIKRLQDANGDLQQLVDALGKERDELKSKLDGSMNQKPAEGQIESSSESTN